MPASDWIRVTRSKRCPICNKPDWCMIAKDASAAICARIEQGADRYLGEAGWLHKLIKDELYRRPLRPPRPVQKLEERKKPPPEWWAKKAEHYESKLTRQLQDELVEQLGVSHLSLTLLRLGWAREHNAYTFPMLDDRHSVIGIRTRKRSGKKLAIKGSTSGIFMPSPTDMPPEDPVCIVEGPSDTAAMIDLGLDVIGRPSCSGGRQFIVRWLKRQQPQRAVLIISDRDGPGRKGAEVLADACRPVCSSVKVIEPLWADDPRDWKAQGANADTIRMVAKNQYEWMNTT